VQSGPSLHSSIALVVAMRDEGHAASSTGRFDIDVTHSRETSRLHALCAIAMVAAIGSALCVAGLADFAASLKRKLTTPAPRFLMEKQIVRRRLQVVDATAICEFDRKRWVAMPWSSMIMQEKTSWQTLGWTQAVWDASWGASRQGVATTTTTGPPTTTLFGLPPATTTTMPFMPWSEQNRCWQDLTEEEKDAAISLGYDIATWSECKKQGCEWPSDVPTEDARCLDKQIYLENKYNFSRPWQNITQLKRDKLVLLGYDPDGTAWANGRKPPSFGRAWSELTYNEREAAKFLGYSSKVWENCEGVYDSPCLDRLWHVELTQRDWVWEELRPGVQELLTDLGWQSRTWFEKETPAVMKAPWLGLTNLQRSAARTLGYSQDTFRGCPMATCLERFAYVQHKWTGVNRPTWMQMKLSERRAWMLLRHNENLWAQNLNPATMQKRWAELSPEQQLEAQFLGHSEGTWQGCNMGWVADRNETGGANATNPNTAVRGRMFVDLPYSEISGNVYGQQVASMPTSFIQVFETAVARALFCGNPPLSNSENTYIGEDGEPLCVLKTEYEMQKNRIRVLNVVEGSIVVDFFIVANATASQVTSRMLFEALVRQVERKADSPLCNDKYFKRYCRRASVQENHLSSESWEDMQVALNGEAKRNAYTESNMCLLHTDAKLGVTRCASSSATGSPQFVFSHGLAGPIGVLFALFLTLAA